MTDIKHIQALHAAISRRSWGDVEIAANAIRDASAISTKLQEPVGETQATVYDWEFINPETGKWDYARTPEKARKLIEAGIKVTPVYTIEQVTQTATTTLAHQPVTAGWDEAIDEAAKVARQYGDTKKQGQWDAAYQIADLIAALKSEGRK